MKKILLIIFALFFNLVSIQACYESVSFGNISNRTNGHQNQCRPLGSYKGSVSNPAACFSYHSSDSSIVTIGVGSNGLCFYSKGHGKATVSISVSGSCMCNGIGVSKTISVTLGEWGIKKIGIEGGYETTPAFEDKIKDYSVTVPYDVKEVTVIATPNDSRSTLTGVGLKAINVGENKFVVSVTSPQGRTDSYTLTVIREEPKEVTSISFDKTDFELSIEDMIELVPKFEPSNATNTNFVWTSSNEKVAVVDEFGNVEAVGAGNAVITVKSANGISASVNIKVPVPVLSIKFDTQIINLDINQTRTLNYTILPNDAHNKNVKFSSSNDDVVSVTDDGVITTKNYGRATITVVTEDGSFRSDCIINVTKKKMENISAVNKNIKLKKGESLTNQIIITPSEFQGELLIWTSSNPNIASVDANGLIKGNNVGTATILVENVDKTLNTYFTVQVYKESNNIIYLITAILIGIPLVLYGIKKYKNKNE